MEAASLVVLSVSSDLVVICVLVRDIGSRKSILNVEDSSDMLITRPAVLNLSGCLGLKIDLVKLDGLEVFNMGSRVASERNGVSFTSLDLFTRGRLVDTDTETTVVNVRVKRAAIVFNAVSAIIVLMAFGSDLEDLAHKCAVGASSVVYPDTELKLSRQLNFVGIFRDINTEGSFRAEAIFVLVGDTEVSQLIAGTNVIDIDAVDNLGFAIGLSGDGQFDLTAFSKTLAFGRGSQGKTATELFSGRVNLVRQTVS